MLGRKYFDLVSGQTVVMTAAEIQHDEYMTATFSQSLGGCDFACCYAEPYGWVPECGCPVHDPEG